MVAERCYETARADVRANPGVTKQFRDYAEAAKSVRAEFRAREAEAEARLGTCDPLEIANALLLMPDKAYEARSEALAGIRLLPLGRRVNGTEDIMAKHVDAWLEPAGPYANLKPHSWTGLMRSVLA